MKRMIFSMVALVAAVACQAQNETNAEWIPEVDEISAGKPIRTVIRMKIEDGWHTYWENPGEGGLPLSIKSDLPDGWTAGEIQYPAPKRFMTGELHGFGYEGEVLFPIVLSPPAGVTGKIGEIKAELSWLVCNDETCLPGKADLVAAKADPELVEKAFEALPKEIPGAELRLLSVEDRMDFALTLPVDSKFDPSSCTVFPTTRNIVDPAAEMKFEKDPAASGQWLCSAPKSEYLADLPTHNVLVFVDAENRAWKIATDAVVETTD